MKIGIAPEIFSAFPGYIRYVLIAEGINNEKNHPALETMLAQTQAALRTDEAFTDVKAHPRIASWRSAFETFGVNPNQCPPSIANLIKRVRGGKELPYINPLVCVFNIVSMKHVLPAGGDDLDKVSGYVRLGYAAGDETYVPLGSPDVSEHPKPGEIILYDTGNRTVFCRAWCWKNGDTSRIDASTTRVAINVDALPPVSAKEGLNAAKETAELLRSFCGGSIEIHRLSEENQCLEI